MPRTKVVFYAGDDGKSPLLEKLENWPEPLQDKCRFRIRRLESEGYELRRPEADYLRDGIYELRFKYWKVNYRVLYFFHEQIAVLFDGITKEDQVPPLDIDRAIAAKRIFANDSQRYSYKKKQDEIQTKD